MPKNTEIAFLAALCALGLPSFAQDAALHEHRSALDGYRPFVQEAVQPWKQTNDTVREVGGWRVYAREISGAQGAASAAANSKPAEARKPAGGQKQADPHAGHAKP